MDMTPHIKDKTGFFRTYGPMDFTFRMIVLGLSLCAGIVFLFAFAQPADAATLKSSANLTNNVITVGDLFGGVPDSKKDHVLGPAPRPGDDMVLDARTLLRVALALDLKWRPQSSTDQIRISSAATMVGASRIKEAIKTKLSDEYVDGRFDLNFFGAEPEIILPHDQPARVEIEKISFDAHENRFDVTLAAPSVEKAAQTLNVSGTIDRLAEVPVLNSTMRRGDMIRAGDVEWIDVRESRLQHDYILKAENIIGMTPRKMIKTGEPVRDTELEQPRLVNRGETVTIVYEKPPLYLTVKGKALRDGARGDTVRVVNVNSNRTIDAVVSDEALVKVVQ